MRAAQHALCEMQPGDGRSCHLSRICRFSHSSKCRRGWPGGSSSPGALPAYVQHGAQPEDTVVRPLLVDQLERHGSGATATTSTDDPSSGSSLPATKRRASRRHKLELRLRPASVWFQLGGARDSGRSIGQRGRASSQRRARPFTLPAHCGFAVYLSTGTDNRREKRPRMLAVILWILASATPWFPYLSRPQLQSILPAANTQAPLRA
jgi:hypothetical protein